MSAIIAIAIVLALASPDGQEKVNVCHKGQPITIAAAAVPAHLANHGDTLGDCEPTGEASSEGPVDTPVCEEDDPCWDCKTMANLVCGTPPIVAPHVHASSPTPSPFTHLCEWSIFDPYCD